MRSLLTLFLVFSLPWTAFSADLLATWQSADGDLMKVAHRDDSHVRMETQPDSYMLLTGDKIYMVSKDEGKWKVVDMDQMAGLMKMYGGVAAGTIQIDDYSTSFQATGRTEKIASYKGTVYLVEVRDENKELIEKDEVVFSKNSDVKRASQAMMAISAKMGNKMGPDISAQLDKAMLQAAENDYGGALRYGTDMRLINIEKGPLPDAYFQLPQNSQLVEVPQPPPAQSGQKGGFFGQLMGDSEDAAKDETRSSTVDAVREGVRGALKGLFD
jgi:hypothetical protein